MEKRLGDGVIGQKVETDWNRRQVLQSGCLLGVCGLGGTAGTSYQATASESATGTKGIAEIHMKSARIAELHQFYQEELRLPVMLTSDKLTIAAGATRLIFTPTKTTESEPFYHFAFNIPENKIEAARQWQKKRTPLLLRGKKEVIHFSAANAHSVYFNDPAGNIVEYIARHDLENSAQGEFSPKDILYASEIGMVVDDVPGTENEIKDKLGLKYARGYKSHSFTPVGDDHALLILVKRDRLWFPNQKQPAKVHPVRATVRGMQAGELKNADLDFKVNVEPG